MSGALLKVYRSPIRKENKRRALTKDLHEETTFPDGHNAQPLRLVHWIAKRPAIQSNHKEHAVGIMVVTYKNHTHTISKDVSFKETESLEL
jgi:hypothetical protein